MTNGVNSKKSILQNFVTYAPAQIFHNKYNMKNISQVTTEISRLKYICDNVDTIVIVHSCKYHKLSPL